MNVRILFVINKRQTRFDRHCSIRKINSFENCMILIDPEYQNKLQNILFFDSINLLIFLCIGFIILNKRSAD